MRRANGKVNRSYGYNQMSRNERRKLPKPKPKPYADTTVTVEKSRASLEKVLVGHGVSVVQWTKSRAGDVESSLLRFQFDHDGQPLTVRLIVDPMSQGDAPPRTATKVQVDKHWMRESMRLHRTLYWYVKAKIEAIEAGLESPLSVWLPAIESGTTTFAERVEQRVHEFANPAYSVGGLLALPEAKQA